MTPGGELQAADQLETDSHAPTPPVEVVCIGVGEIGAKMLEEAVDRDDLRVVGAVDPPKAGGSLRDVDIVASLDEVAAPASVAIIATGSSIKAIAPQIEAALNAGLNVVSTCEELTYPWQRAPEEAARLDALAIARGLAIVGAGINPGFVMDVLPAHACAASSSVESVRVVRAVDLRQRRPQLRGKLGVGLSHEEWAATAATNGYGHVGLVESARLCALALGWQVGDVAFSRDPVVTEDEVIGVREVASAADGRGHTVELTLVFELDGLDEDRVVVEGRPSLDVRLVNGAHGDTATVARALHSARLAPSLRPGLRLPIEVPAWAPPVVR